MCGIVGFTGPARPRLLRNMCASIRHRGPDDDGFLEADGANLGMRRLAIVDLAGGKQPVANEDRTVWTVFNGEIYNHQDLRRDLLARGHVFASDHSDTEVIVHLYEEYGPDWVNRANGMFGLAIWDARIGRLLLYRDRLGKKPLYYSATPDGLAFASEIKALLLCPEVSREFDSAALYGYFGQKNLAAPDTAYRDIKQLPPGAYLTWSRDQGLSRPVLYWRPDFAPRPEVPDEAEAARVVHDLLADAVRLRMDCDVSYGAYLSGGMDSSAVTALMCRYSSKPVTTFCLGYADLHGGQEAGKDRDVRYSRMMAERLGTDHHELIVSADDFARDLTAALAAMDEPYSGAISTYFLSAFMRRHITVAISGDGSDELFASYLPQRLAFPLAAWRKAVADGVAPEELETRLPLTEPAQAARLRRLLACPGGAEAGWRDTLAVFSHAERRELLAPAFLEAAGDAVGRNPFEALARDLTAADPLNAQLEIDQRGLLPDQILPFVDRLSMAHSIEVRCPFLDHRLVEYANRLPGRYKIKDGVTKYILRQALDGLLPDEVINRPKEGFVQPVYTWMRAQLQGRLVDALDSLPEDFVRRAAVNRLRDRFLAGEAGLEAKIWNLACFALWLRARG